MSSTKKDNTIMTFLKGISPASLIFIVVLVVGFIVNEAVFNANASSIARTNTEQIAKQEMKIEKVEKKATTNKENIVENRHRGDMIIQTQRMIVEELIEIKETIQKIQPRCSTR